MWKLYKWNGHYIMGDLISQHSSESAAIKAAKKSIKFKSSDRVETKEQVLIWLDSETSEPLGVIVKKFKKTKSKGDATASTG